MNDTMLDERAPAAAVEHSGSGVAQRLAGMSPRAKARLAGVFEALEGTASAGGQVVILGRLVVPGNAAATAHWLVTSRD